MKLSIFTTAIASAALLTFTAGSAGAQFSGYYDPANWDFYDDAGGSLITANAPHSVTLIGGNDGVEGDTMLTITVPASGTVSFDWFYSTADTGFQWDPAYYYHDGWNLLEVVGDPTQASGSVEFAVDAGDLIGFRVHTVDGQFGAGSLQVFLTSAPIPEPTSLGLLGLSGLALMRRRR